MSFRPLRSFEFRSARALPPEHERFLKAQSEPVIRWKRKLEFPDNVRSFKLLKWCKTTDRAEFTMESIPLPPIKIKKPDPEPEPEVPQIEPEVEVTKAGSPERRSASEVSAELNKNDTPSIEITGKVNSATDKIPESSTQIADVVNKDSSVNKSKKDEKNNSNITSLVLPNILSRDSTISTSDSPKVDKSEASKDSKSMSPEITSPAKITGEKKQDSPIIPKKVEVLNDNDLTKIVTETQENKKSPIHQDENKTTHSGNVSPKPLSSVVKDDKQVSPKEDENEASNIGNGQKELDSQGKSNISVSSKDSPKPNSIVLSNFDKGTKHSNQTLSSPKVLNSSLSTEKKIEISQPISITKISAVSIPAIDSNKSSPKRSQLESNYDQDSVHLQLRDNSLTDSSITSKPETITPKSPQKISKVDSTVKNSALEHNSPKPSIGSESTVKSKSPVSSQRSLLNSPARQKPILQLSTTIPTTQPVLPVLSKESKLESKEKTPIKESGDVNRSDNKVNETEVQKVSQDASSSESMVLQKKDDALFTKDSV